MSSFHYLSDLPFLLLSSGLLSWDYKQCFMSYLNEKEDSGDMGHLVAAKKELDGLRNLNVAQLDVGFKSVLNGNRNVFFKASSEENNIVFQIRIEDVGTLIKLLPIIRMGDSSRFIDLKAPLGSGDQSKVAQTIEEVFNEIDYKEKLISISFYDKMNDDIAKMKVGWGFFCGFLSKEHFSVKDGEIEGRWTGLFAPKHVRESGFEGWDGSEDFVVGFLSRCGDLDVELINIINATESKSIADFVVDFIPDGKGFEKVKDVALEVSFKNKAKASRSSYGRF